MSAVVGTPTGYLQIVCLTWFFYDWVITADLELEFIWLRDWTFTKLLFLLMRWTTAALLLSETIVYVFLENLSKAQCDAFSWGSAVGTVVVILQVEVILQLRIYVMYGRSRRILYINGALCVLEVICAGVLMATYFSQAQYVPAPAWIIGSCYDTRPKVLSTVWVSPLCYEIYLAVLAVRKVVQDHRLRGNHANAGSMLSILVRDSVGWFFLIAACAGVNIILWSETAVTPGDSAVGLVHAAGGIGGARLILSMRQAASKPPPLPVVDSTVDTTITANFELNTLKSSRQPISSWF